MDEDNKLKKGADIQPRQRRLNPLERKTAAKKKTIKLDIEVIARYCEEGFGLDVIARWLGSSPLAVARAVERAVRKGTAFKVDHLVPQDIRSTIEEAFEALNTTSVKRVHQYLAETASEAQIRIVRGILQSRNREL